MPARFLKYILALLVAVNISWVHAEEDELLIIEDDTELILEMEDSDDTADGDLLLIEDDNADEDTLHIDTGDEPESLIIDESERTLTIESSTNKAATQVAEQSTTRKSNSGSKAFTFGVDELWLEYGHFSDSNAMNEHAGYFHSQFTVQTGSENWEFQVSARVDGYGERGDSDWDDVGLDYDESFIRYKDSDTIITVGAQKVIWGRIDEFPPNDRLSTQDFRRVYDELADRRLASPAVRVEQFFAAGKVDVVVYPDFREAQLPDRESNWYPVNRQTGEILGLETTAAIEAIVRNTPIRENVPDSEGGAGLRFSSLGDFDYAVTIQKGRQSVPYFSYNPDTNVIEGQYPRTWIVGADAGFEAIGGTLKVEAAWLSDVSITETNGNYDTVEAISWGLAWEIFPGDGDGRLNLQLTGQNLVDAPSVLDRENILAFNGTFETPFADENWRFEMRFNVGLDEEEYYLNPQLGYTGWESQEVYLQFHYFAGDKATAGGFYEDNSLLTLGWQIEF